MPRSYKLSVLVEDAALGDALRLFLTGEGHAVATPGDDSTDLVLIDFANAVSLQQQQWLAPLPTVLLPEPLDADRLLALIRTRARQPKPVILVLEEDPGVGKMLKLTLEVYGFVVAVVGSGEKALGFFEKERDEIDVVLVDMDLRRSHVPTRQTVAGLRVLDPQVKCCGMTGDRMAGAVEQLFGLGLLQVFVKPFPSIAVWLGCYGN